MSISKPVWKIKEMHPDFRPCLFSLIYLTLLWWGQRCIQRHDPAFCQCNRSVKVISKEGGPDLCPEQVALAWWLGIELSHLTWGDLGSSVHEDCEFFFFFWTVIPFLCQICQGKSTDFISNVTYVKWVEITKFILLRNKNRWSKILNGQDLCFIYYDKP